MTGRRQLGHADVFAAIFALSFAVARFLPVLELPYTCPFHALTGIPCATCGMTHAFVGLAHGQVAAAFAASPLGALVAGIGWLLAAADGVRLLRGWPLPRLGPAAARALATGGLLALIANWAFLVVAHR